MKKTLLITTALLTAMMSAMPVSADPVPAQNVRVKVNGSQLQSAGQYPSAVIVEETTFVPLPEISMKLIYQNKWEANTKTISLTDGKRIVRLQIGSRIITKEDLATDTVTTVEISHAPIIISGKTYVPLRAIADAFDVRVHWNANTKTADISSPNNGVGGDNIYWKLDGNGVLTIDGTGPMHKFMDANNTSTSAWREDCLACDSSIMAKIVYGVTNISDGAFDSITTLSSVEIPLSVTSIGVNAFARCYGLKKVEIPMSVTSIGKNAFINCTELQEITIPSSVTTIGADAFKYCSKLTKVKCKQGSKADNIKLYPDGVKLVYS